MNLAAQAVRLQAEIAACTLCAAHLPHGPRPVVQFSPRSRLIIIGQAPGSRVHASGVPWDDDSGNRLRDWLGLDAATFYDPDCVALIPMGLCYPGKARGGDKPPRPECAPQWHRRILELLPPLRMTLLVGAHAQAAYLPATRTLTMTERVRRGSSLASFIVPLVPLPHPAWRVRMWMAKHTWFEADFLPPLRRTIATLLS